MDTISMKTEPIFLDNKDFQSVIIKIFFPFDEKEEELAKSVLLPSLLTSISEHYPTEEAFHKEKKRNYILGINCLRTVIGNTGAYVFNLVIPDTYSLGRDVMEKQFAFFQEAIYHPALENNAFLEKEVEREKRNIKAAMDNALKNIRPYQSIRIRELIDDEGILSRDLIHHPEDVDLLNGSNLYEYYEKNILHNQPMIYVMGNVDQDKITKLCKKYLYQEEFQEKEYPVDFYHFLKIRDKVQEVEENSTFKDSSLSYVYKVRDMKCEDRLYLSLLKDLLTSLSSRLMHKRFRTEEELIYSSKVLPYVHFGAFEITVYIQKEHEKKVRKAYDDLMKDLRDEDVIAPLLENIKKRNHINLLRRLDDKYFLLEDFILDHMGIEESLVKFYQRIEKVTAKDICSFIDRLVLDTVYFIKEEEHE